MAEREAHCAIDVAFREVATVHHLMSFHDPGSDLSRLNQEVVGKPVEVHPYTCEVLQQALSFSASTDGCFDVTVGAELVEWELLPRLEAGKVPRGSWHDIELLPPNRVVFHRPLYVDLGGIAKGFAVDRATECLRAHGALQTVVNAGGDIRVQGKDTEPIRLSAESSLGSMPVLELTDGSVASSSGHLQRRWYSGRLCGPHVDGVHRSPAPTDRFVCIAAERCVVADALTKVVMVKGPDSQAILRQFGASAYIHDPGNGWQYLEVESAVVG
jgi:thiamine biosynthesis lipoprotein